MAFGTVADADRYRGDRDRRGHDRVRDNRRDDRVRDNRRDDRRYDDRRVRDNRRGRYNGPVRADRRRIERVRQLRPRDGRFYFHGGRTVVYNRPVIRERYYNVRVRPQVIVESYPSQHGYIWVSGNWSWNGYEWVWNSGHYAPDPSISVYYDDDSYDGGFDDGY